MRISEHIILSDLHRGGCIRTFWRRPVRQSGSPAPVMPDGTVLESPDGSGDSLLSYADFDMVKKYLFCVKEWSQVVGCTEFGGATWQLLPDTAKQSQFR